MVSSSHSRTVFFGARCEHTVASLRVRGPVGLEAFGTSLGPLKEIALERDEGEEGRRKERKREREREREKRNRWTRELGTLFSRQRSLWSKLHRIWLRVLILHGASAARYFLSLPTPTAKPKQARASDFLASKTTSRLNRGEFSGICWDSRNFCEFFKEKSFDLEKKFGHRKHRKMFETLRSSVPKFWEVNLLKLWREARLRLWKKLLAEKILRK